MASRYGPRGLNKDKRPVSLSARGRSGLFDDLDLDPVVAGHGFLGRALIGGVGVAQAARDDLGSADIVCARGCAAEKLLKGDVRALSGPA